MENQQDNSANLLYNRWANIGGKPKHSGSANVYRVIDTNKELEGELALKIPHRLDRIDRFKKEIEALQTLSASPSLHPNVVPLIASYFPENTEERPYLVTPWLTGGDLRQHAIAQESGRYYGQIKESVKVLLPIADAIKYLHEQGLHQPDGYMAHRDIKPANILFDGQDTPKLTDFGCVFISEVETDERLTDTGDHLGSQGYNAPEVRNGRYDGDHRPSDIYSLGATLYAILAGINPPIDGHILTDEFHLQVKFQDAAFISVMSLLGWCMKKSPTERPDISTLMIELESLLDIGTSEQISVKSISLSSRLKRLNFDSSVLASKRSEEELKGYDKRFSALGQKCIDAWHNHPGIQTLLLENASQYRVMGESSQGSGPSASLRTIGDAGELRSLFAQYTEDLLDRKFAWSHHISLTLSPVEPHFKKLVRTSLVIVLGLVDGRNELIIFGTMWAFDISKQQQQRCDWPHEITLYSTSPNSIALEKNLPGLATKLADQAIQAIEWGLDYFEKGEALPVTT